MRRIPTNGVMLRTNKWVLSLAIALSAAASACGAYEPLDVAQNVDLQRVSGRWYEIAKLPRATQANCTNTTSYYAVRADGMTITNECRLGSPTGPLRSISMDAKVSDPTVPAKLALDIGGFYGDFWILEVGADYEYAVIGHPSRAYFWILSRTPTLDPSVLSGILTRAQAKKFDTSKLEYTTQRP